MPSSNMQSPSSVHSWASQTLNRPAPQLVQASQVLAEEEALELDGGEKEKLEEERGGGEKEKLELELEEEDPQFNPVHTVQSNGFGVQELKR